MRPGLLQSSKRSLQRQKEPPDYVDTAGLTTIIHAANGDMCVGRAGTIGREAGIGWSSVGLVADSWRSARRLYHQRA